MLGREMDNTTKSFAQKIVSELEAIRRLIYDAVSLPRPSLRSTEDTEREAENIKLRPKLQTPQPSDTTNAHPLVTQSYVSAHRPGRRFEWLKEHSVEMIGVFVLVIYTTYTALNLSAIRESNNINREAVISVQRAFVTPQAFMALAITDATRKIVTDWQFYIPWGNSGVTPTRYAVTHSSFAPYYGVIPGNFPFPDLGPSKRTPLVLGPKATLTSSALQVPVGVLRSINPTGLHLYFWGWLSYNDTFARTKRHVTEVCRELTQINGDVSNPNQPVQWIFTLCDHHNCVDEECADYEIAIGKR
jgi:hypothetical protein